MSDKTLPIGGAWVMLVKPLPTAIKPPILSIWYALPDKVFDFGANHVSYFNLPNSLPPTDAARRALQTLWRVRRKAKPKDDLEQASWDNDIAYLEKFGPLRHRFLEQRVKILTPEGTVAVNPDEYNIIQDITDYMELVDGEHIKLVELGGVKSSSKLADQLFYCRQRGIPKADALKMLMGEVKKPNVAYIHIHEGYAEYFGIG